MTEQLGFVSTLKDLASGGFRRMASTASSSFSSIKRGLGGISNSTVRPKSSINDLNNRLNDLRKTRSLSIDSRQIRSLGREIDKTERRLNRLENSGRKNSGGGGFGLGGMLAGAGLAAAGGSVLNAGMQAQAQRASFEVLAGSSEAGKQMFDELNKFAQDSIFGQEVFKNAQTMKAFGAANQEVMPDLKMLGDISMGNKERFESLTLAFSQSRATGKLMGQDLLQMVNAGFNPLQIISEKTGKSMATLKDEMSKGMISFDMVKGAFQSATSEGGKFYNMTNKIADTDFGKWEALKGQVSGLAMAFGLKLAPILGNLIDKYLAPMATWIGKHIDLVTGLGGALLGGVAAYKAVTIAQGVLNAVMYANPIGLIVGGIAALAGGFAYAYKKVDWFRGAIKGSWGAIKEFAKTIKDVVISAITSMANGIAGIGKTIMLMFKGEFKQAFETGKQAVKDLSGISTLRTAMDGGKKIGKAWTTGYKNGLLEVKTGDGNASVDGFRGAAASATGTTATGGVASAGNVFDTSGTTGNSTASKITGGGNKEVKITVHKMFDNIVINANSFTESTQDIEAKVREMFYRLLNSVEIA